MRIIRAASKRAASRAVAAVGAGIIRVVGVNIGPIWAGDRDRDSVENGDRISRKNLRAVAAKRDVRGEVDRSAATARVKFQRRISRKRADADIEHAVCAERANFEHTA